MDDLISIIVPVYNIADYLTRSVGSLLNQSYKNIEVIAVDDGSKDDSLSVLQKLAKEDNRIHVIHQENGGVTRARFAGIKIATGEWIGFMDGDDEIEKDMYEHLLLNAKAYHADISHCGYQMVFPSHIDYYYNTKRLIQQDKQTGLKDLIKGEFIEPGLCNKLYHRSLIQDLLYSRKVDFSIKYTEDLLMNYYLFKESNCAIYEDWCPYHYMMRKNSASHQAVSKHKLLDPIRVTQILLSETTNSKELHQILKSRYIRQLITLASINTNEELQFISIYKRKALKKLRKMIPEVLISNNYSFKLKSMALLTGLSPDAFSIIHGSHVKVTGLDKKYSVE